MVITNFYLYMPEHGDYKTELKKWFCSYWMTEDKWMDIPDYSPTSMSRAEKENDGDDNLQEQM